MTSAWESVASRVPYNTINFGVKYEPVLLMCRRMKSQDNAVSLLDIPCLRSVFVLFFRRRGVMGSECACVCVCVCACFTYFTMKVDKDAEGARPLPPLLF